MTKPIGYHFYLRVCGNRTNWQIVPTARKDLISGVLVLGLAALVTLAIWDMPSGPAGFPKLIAMGLGVCGFIVILRTLIGTPSEEKPSGEVNWPLSLMVVAVWLALIFAARSVGFLIVGFGFLVLLAWLLLGRPRGAKSVAVILAFSAGFSVALWLIFGLTLGVAPPGGWLM